jgi:hypothetical protein
LVIGLIAFLTVLGLLTLRVRRKTV